MIVLHFQYEGICKYFYYRRYCIITNVSPFVRLSPIFRCTFHLSMSIYSVNILYFGLSVRLQMAICKNKIKIFSRLLFKIEALFLFERFIWWMRIYSINNMSVSMSVSLFVRLQRA